LALSPSGTRDQILAVIRQLTGLMLRVFAALIARRCKVEWGMRSTYNWAELLCIWQ